MLAIHMKYICTRNMARSLLYQNQIEYLSLNYLDSISNQPTNKMYSLLSIDLTLRNNLNPTSLTRALFCKPL